MTETSRFIKKATVWGMNTACLAMLYHRLLLKLIELTHILMFHVLKVFQFPVRALSVDHRLKRTN